MRVKYHRDSRAIAALLKSPEFGGAVASLAERVGAGVLASKPGADVVVDRYTTDRAAASVTVRDVRARGWVARDGLLIRDAAAIGLEVKAR